MASSHGTPAFGTWRVRDGNLSITEEGREYPVDVLELTADVFRIRIRGPGEPVVIRFAPADAVRRSGEPAGPAVRRNHETDVPCDRRPPPRGVRGRRGRRRRGTRAGGRYRGQWLGRGHAEARGRRTGDHHHRHGAPPRRRGRRLRHPGRRRHELQPDQPARRVPGGRQGRRSRGPAAGRRDIDRDGGPGGRRGAHPGEAGRGRAAPTVDWRSPAPGGGSRISPARRWWPATRRPRSSSARTDG